ncbi:MAG: LCP family protein [Oscillospiraceae bacterium]
MAKGRITEPEAFSATDEFSLNELIHGALKNKNKQPSLREDHAQRYDTGEIQTPTAAAAANRYRTESVSVEQIIAETNHRRGYAQPAAEPDAQPAAVASADSAPEAEEAEELSIEKMVARAMEKKKLASLDLRAEKIATSADIVGAEELAQLDAIEEDSENFFRRHKKKLIAITSIAGVFILLLFGASKLFSHYYGMLSPDDSTIVDISQNAIDKNDTVKVDDYDQKLLNSLKTGDQIMSDENVMNILLVAEDLRDTTGDSRGNTDVMMLVSVNKKTETITLTSFMRDIYIGIPGYNAAKLNSAYSKGGSELLKQTLTQTFGIQIDRYVLVNFNTFMEIVEAIGGMDFDVTDAEAKSMKAPMAEQNKLLGNAYGTDYISGGGTYHFNGNQALAYCRIRYGCGDDYGRTRRQRNAIEQMIDKSKKLSLLEINDLLTEILPDIKTNITESEAKQLCVDMFLNYKNYTRQQIQIPASGTFTDQTIRNEDCLVPNFSENIKILQETIYGSTKVTDQDIQNDDPNKYIKTTTASTPPVTAAPTSTTPSHTNATTTTTPTKTATATSTTPSTTTASSTTTKSTTTTPPAVTTPKPTSTPTQTTPAATASQTTTPAAS